MVNPDRPHDPPLAQYKSRKESVHMVEIRQVQEKRAWKQLQTAASIGRAVSKHPAPYSVSDLGCEALPPAVLPAFTIAGDQQRRRLRSGKPDPPQFRDVGGVG